MHNERISIGTVGISGNSPFAVGVGYVVIPYGVNREDYVKSCYQTQTICVRTEGGDFFKNVYISDSALADIIFPEDVSSSSGSIVVFAFVPKHNAPVVFSVLGSKDTVGALVEEGQFKVSKAYDGASVAIEGRAKSGASLAMSASGVSSKMVFKLSSPDEDSVFEIKTKGDVTVYGSKVVRLFAAEEVALELVDEKLEPTAHIRYNKNTGIWEIFGDSNSSGQSVLLGQDSIKKIGEICDILSDFAQAVSTMQVSVLAPQSPSGPPLNPAPFIQASTKIMSLKSQLDQLLSKTVKTD